MAVIRPTYRRLVHWGRRVMNNIFVRDAGGPEFVLHFPGKVD